MRQAVACRKCGKLIPSSADNPLAGCPYCFVQDALSTDPPAPVEASRPPARMGKYSLVAKLGAGGMGEVWKAWDTELERWVALKLLRHVDPRELERFTREARTAAALSHPAIAAVYEAGAIDGKPFIAMQLIEGRTLAEWPRIDRKRLVTLVRDAARAVGFAHRQGIIHRDLKPTNLMASEVESEPRIVVMDFGLARRIQGAAKLSRTGTLAGTPLYMSPEQARGRRVDARSDIYSLGATLYELLCGRTPFTSDDPSDLLRRIVDDEPPPLRTIDKTVPRDLETIALKCLEKDPARRYETADALAGDLDRWLTGEPILARPAGSIYRIGRKLAKRKSQVVAAVATVGLIVTAAVVLPMWRSKADALSKHEFEAREKRNRYERARPHLEAGRTILERMRLRMREAYTLQDLKALGSQARTQFGRALEAAPDHPEAHLGIAMAFTLVKEKGPALESLGRAIKADVEFAPAFLERVRLLIDDYEQLTHDYGRGERLETTEAKALRERLDADLAKARRFSKEYPQQTYALALLAFAHGEYAKAAEALERYVEVDAEDAGAHWWRGHSLYHLDRHSEAVESFSRALVCDTRQSSAFNMRGSSKRALGLLDGAIDDHTKAIELDPESASAYLNRGEAKRRKGLLDDSIQDSTRAIELQPNLAMAYNNRGAALGAKGLHEAAIEDHTKAIELDPQLATAYNNRGSCKADKGLLDEAISDYRKAIELDPKYASPHCNLGNASTKKGLREEAIANYTEAIKLDPNFASAYVGRALALNAKGLHEAAIEDYSKAIKLRPDVADTFYNRGNARKAIDRLDEAIEDYTEAIRLQSAHDQAYVNRGIAKMAKGLHEEALEDFEKAIGIQPKNWFAYLNRAMLREAKGLFEEAVTDYRKVLDLAPPSWRYRDRVQESLRNLEATRLFHEADRLHELKKYAEAIEKFKAIVESHPKTKQAIDAGYKVAGAYALLGEKPDALDWLEKAVKMGWTDAAHIEKNSDLDGIRGEPRLKALLEKLKRD